MTSPSRTPPSTWKFAHPVNIYVYRNGVVGEKPQLVHISLDQKKCMSTVLEAIEKRLKLSVGYPIGLYNMDGTKVKKSYHLEMYNNYVVVTNIEKRFKLVDYGKVKGPMVIAGNDSKHVSNQKSNLRKQLLNPKISLERQDPPTGAEKENHEAASSVGTGPTGEIAVFGIKSESRTIPTQCCSDEVMFVNQEDEDEVESDVRNQTVAAAAASAHLIDLIRRYTNVGSEIFQMFQDKIKKDLERDLGGTPPEGDEKKAVTKRAVEQALTRLAQKSCHNTFSKVQKSKTLNPEVDSNENPESGSTSHFPPPTEPCPPSPPPPPTPPRSRPIPETPIQVEAYTMTVDKPPLPPHLNPEIFQTPEANKSLGKLEKLPQDDLNNNSNNSFMRNSNLLRNMPTFVQRQDEIQCRSQLLRSTSTGSFEVCRTSSSGGRTPVRNLRKHYPRGVLKQIASLLHQYDTNPPPLTTTGIKPTESSETYTIHEDDKHPPTPAPQKPPRPQPQPVKVERACGSNCAVRHQRNVCAQVGASNIHTKAPAEVRVLPSTKERPTRVVDRFYNTPTVRPSRSKSQKPSFEKHETGPAFDSDDDFYAKNYGAGRYSRKKRKEAKEREQLQQSELEPPRRSSLKQPTLPPPPPSPPEEFRGRQDEPQLPANYPQSPYQPRGAMASSSRVQAAPVPNYQAPRYQFQPEDEQEYAHPSLSRTQALPTPSTLQFVQGQVPRLPDYVTAPAAVGTSAIGGSLFPSSPVMARFVQTFTPNPMPFVQQQYQLNRLPPVIAQPQQQPQMVMLRNGQMMRLMPFLRTPAAPVMKPVMAQPLLAADFQNNNKNYVNKLVRIPPSFYPVTAPIAQQFPPQNQYIFYPNSNKSNPN